MAHFCRSLRQPYSDASDIERLICLNEKLLEQLKSKVKHLKKLFRKHVVLGSSPGDSQLSSADDDYIRGRNSSLSTVDSDQMIQAESQRVGWYHNVTKTLPLSAQSLASFSALAVDPSTSCLADIVKTIKVFLKSNALKNLTILDTPGFQQSVQYRERRTNYALSQAHMWIYLSRADSLDTGQELRFVQQLKEISDRGLIVLTNYDLLTEKAPSFDSAVRSKLKDLEGVLEVDRAPATAANLLPKLREATKSGRKLKKKFDLEMTELLGFVCGIPSEKLQEDFAEYVGSTTEANSVYNDAAIELSGLVSVFEQLRVSTQHEMESVLLSTYNELDCVSRTTPNSHCAISDFDFLYRGRYHSNLWLEHDLEVAGSAGSATAKPSRRAGSSLFGSFDELAHQDGGQDDSVQSGRGEIAEARERPRREAHQRTPERAFPISEERALPVIANRNDS